MKIRQAEEKTKIATDIVTEVAPPLSGVVLSEGSEVVAPGAEVGASVAPGFVGPLVGGALVGPFVGGAFVGPLVGGAFVGPSVGGALVGASVGASVGGSVGG